VKNGAAKDLELLANRQINPVLTDSQGADPAAKTMGVIVKGIENIC
jgi:predicted nucleic acid-binding protein